MDFNINPGEMHSSIFKPWAISPMLDTSRIGQNAWRRESFRPPRNLAFSRMKHVLLSTYPGIRQTMCQSCWLCQFQFWGSKYPLQNPRWQVPIKLGESCQALCALKNGFPCFRSTDKEKAMVMSCNVLFCDPIFIPWSGRRKDQEFAPQRLHP